MSNDGSATAPSRTDLRIVTGAGVIMQHPHRWRIEIVHLPTLRAPDERQDGAADNDERQGDHEIQDAHVAGSRSKVKPYHAPSTTVTEATGMRIAAIRGVMVPVMASPAPMRL